MPAPRDTPAPAVETLALRRTFSAPRHRGGGPVEALAGVDVRIERGEIFGLLGPNGAGKTTTAGMLTTRVVPTSGRAYLAGVDVAAHPALAKQLSGIVSQQNTLDRQLTVWENLYFHGRLFGMGAKQSRRVADELLGTHRHGDVDGWQIPGRFLDFLRGAPAEPLVDVVRHNQGRWRERPVGQARGREHQDRFPRPRRLLGGEGWRDLDWLTGDDKVALDVSARESLSAALIGVFDSQITGGKRYDLAVAGLRRAHATLDESHHLDATAALAFYMDLTPLLTDTARDPGAFVEERVQRFAADVKDRIQRLRRTETRSR